MQSSVTMVGERIQTTAHTYDFTMFSPSAKNIAGEERSSYTISQSTETDILATESTLSAAKHINLLSSGLLLAPSTRPFNLSSCERLVDLFELRDMAHEMKDHLII
jgi:hypothetical protein